MEGTPVEPTVKGCRRNVSDSGPCSLSISFAMSFAVSLSFNLSSNKAASASKAAKSPYPGLGRGAETFCSAVRATSGTKGRLRTSDDDGKGLGFSVTFLCTTAENPDFRVAVSRRLDSEWEPKVTTPKLMSASSSSGAGGGFAGRPTMVRLACG